MTSDLDGYSSRLWKNAYNRGWQDALARAVDEAHDVNIDGEVFKCVQVETLIGLGMSREMAIKALEQQSVLDKIRAEIAVLDDADYDYEGYYKAVTDAVKIIDKYKAESKIEK